MAISENLASSDERLRAIVDSLQEGVVTADANGYLIDWNAAALRLHGFNSLAEARRSFEEISKKFELLTLDGEIIPIREWPLPRVLRGETISAWEVRVRRTDQDLDRIFSYSGTPVYRAGEIYLAVIALQDVTDRRQAEEALRRSEANLRDFFENATVGLHWVGPDGRIIWANRTELEMLGYTAEEYIGRHIAEFHADEPVIEEILSTLCARQNIHNREARLRCKDGSIRTVLINSSVLWDGDRFVHTRCFTRDVTERKRQEELIREAGENFSALAENIDQLAWMANGDGYIYWYNRRWHEYTGTTPEQMEGWGWQSVHDPDVLPSVLERWKSSLATGEPFDMEFPLRGADGVFRPFLTRVHPVRDQEGRVVRWFGTNTDVSEPRRIQDELRQMTANLELLVAERTADLVVANEQLQGFTYSVAHDFRQHIRALNVNASLVLEDYGERLDDEGRQHLERLRASARQLGTLTDELLQHAKLGKLPIREVEVDLSALAMDCVAELEQSAQCKPGTTFVVQPGVTVIGDTAMLRLVVGNLLDNACKFSGRAENPLVEFGRDEEGCFVRDNGVGFDPAYAEKVWNAFERLHATSGFEGTGIGLANVKRIVERHGGKVWATSEPGRGATFRFWLPS